MNKLEIAKVYINAQTTDANRIIENFKAKAVQSPMDAMRWYGEEAMVAEITLQTLDGEWFKMERTEEEVITEGEKMVARMMRMVMENARGGSQSTNPIANLQDAAKLKVMARTIELIEEILKVLK